MYGERLARWERAVEWPLTIAAVAFLGAYAAQILARSHGAIQGIAEVVLWVTWAAFVVDYLVRLTLAVPRGRWFVRHLLDLAIVLLPVFRPLRLMRFLTVIALIQRNTGAMLRGKVVIYTVGATVLTVVVSALAVLDAEQSAGGTITSLGDALWWAVVTITTVGYGDFTPITVQGRVIAVGLMVGGIALIGVVTATLASWIVEKVSLENRSSAAATSAQVDALRDEIAELRRSLDARSS
ncbi:potassium channel family protein [Microbacterium sp.]|uniref:potassium channel family protein n=1 Tax=Microbacterium sp. TaxID=51671 RepID=UPI0039E4B6ED